MLLSRQRKTSNSLLYVRTAFAFLSVSLILPLSSYSAAYVEDELLQFWFDMVIFTLWCFASISMYAVSPKIVLLSNSFLIWYMVSTHYGWINLFTFVIDSIILPIYNTVTDTLGLIFQTLYNFIKTITSAVWQFLIDYVFVPLYDVLLQLCSILSTLADVLVEVCEYVWQELVYICQKFVTLYVDYILYPLYENIFVPWYNFLTFIYDQIFAFIVMVYDACVSAAIKFYTFIDEYVITPLVVFMIQLIENAWYYTVHWILIPLRNILISFCDFVVDVTVAVFEKIAYLYGLFSGRLTKLLLLIWDWVTVVAVNIQWFIVNVIWDKVLHPFLDWMINIIDEVSDIIWYWFLVPLWDVIVFWCQMIDYYVLQPGWILIQSIFDLVCQIFWYVISIIVNIWNAIVSVLEIVWSHVVEIVIAVWDAILSVLIPIGDKLFDLADKMASVGTIIVNSMIAAINGLVDALLRVIESLHL